MSEVNERPWGDPRGVQDPLFQDLMSYRIREILFVSSAYDSYILQEDALLGESLDFEYRQLNLSSSPRITQVSTGEEALAALGERPYDLIITVSRLGEMELHEFGRAVKAGHPDLPVVLLAYTAVEAARVKELGWRESIDQVFIWHGDVRLFVAIIKFLEDRRNADRDTRIGGVRAIVLVENSVRFYSSYLPLLYTELMRQSQSVMADGVNVMQRVRRMKARPKVLLAETFEEAWALYERYRANILGVISDARFPREGKPDAEAGLELVRRLKTEDEDTPVLIQSSDESFASGAHDLRAAFINKRSPRLLDELRRFIRSSLGFGDFVFLMPDGGEVGRVPDLAAMPAALRRVPDASLRYHALHNHFSNWCMARTEFALAERIRPIKVSQFESTDELRRYLIDAFSQLRSDSQRGVVAEFSAANFDEASGLARIGSGSMGGKGRGLGFMNALLSRSEPLSGAGDVRIFVPTCAVIGTNVFDDFLRENDLSGLALSEACDEAIADAFLRARLPMAILDDLRAFVEKIRCPIAVRSSSLLEDSHDQPFAGIYRTIMLANGHDSPDVRLEELGAAIKLVYASTFFSNAKAYLQNTQHRMEEEKMGVVLQTLAGRRHGDHFYPDIAGVARSYNYYPVLGMDPEEGTAVVAMGLGKTVVEGERSVRFSPGRPQNLPQFSSTEAYLENAQQQFYALDLRRTGIVSASDPDGAIVRLDLDVAESHGTLGPLASVYSRDNDAVYDGISRHGVRLVTFAPFLKSESFPLPKILTALLALGGRAMSGPVEIEFAVNLKPENGGPPEFAFLQIRPMTIEAAAANIDEILRRVDPSQILCSSPRALGQGRLRDMRDIVYVKPAPFDRSRTAAIAAELDTMNDRLARDCRPYLLIGPGRWGTSDPWLGIPVQWHEINAAHAIIETDLVEVPVPPSEGTHFFQNITSLGIGYFTVHSREGGGFVDYEWLDAQPAAAENGFLRHVRVEAPLDLWVDGKSRRGIILKSVIGR